MRDERPYSQTAETGCSKSLSSKAAASEEPEAYPLGYVKDLSDVRTKLADFFSILLDGGIGKTQGEETAEAAFFRSEETGKAKPDPFGTTGTHDGAVNHDGIIVLGGMKLQHHRHPIGMRWLVRTRHPRRDKFESIPSTTTRWLGSWMGRTSAGYWTETRS